MHSLEHIARSPSRRALLKGGVAAGVHVRERKLMVDEKDTERHVTVLLAIEPFALPTIIAKDMRPFPVEFRTIHFLE